MVDYYDPGSLDPSKRVPPSQLNQNKGKDNQAAPDEAPAKEPAASHNYAKMSPDDVFARMQQMGQLSQQYFSIESSVNTFTAQFSPQQYDALMGELVSGIRKSFPGIQDSAAHSLAEDVFLDRYLGLPEISHA
jgi:hypothetical protein